MSLRERMLAVMDRKDHPTWHRLAAGELTRAQLRVHYAQEWATYVGDFPVLLGRVIGLSPPAEARRLLAENLYEEETGALSLGRPHADLFLEQMEAIGLPRADFERVELLPEAEGYRAWIDGVTEGGSWIEAAALVTVFIEGSRNDRAELGAEPEADPAAIEAEVRAHPLARHYGADPARLGLVRAHRMVERGHRHDAWSMVVGWAEGRYAGDAVVEMLEESLGAWLRYRDAVGRAMDGR